MIEKVSFNDFEIVKNIAEKKDFSFGEILKTYLQKVNTEQKIADEMINRFLAGEADIHQVMIALEKAELSFQLMMQVRNKLIEAYHEIMRMQI
ncbi:MAG TPA: flagellar hook-basal body complex protein FliE [Candidatus Desulfofervidus auxilii]|uniref:Flagellar hook-basal body complex protein FliE n=1 Tax=Desulfofervidus auxilii TaxID=1621989 RepID=A0A7C0YAX8_DESA2|nr:flagellar hook-basal body complex protein FliE [Candidatus Desulfofervidus auxilii]